MFILDFCVFISIVRAHLFNVYKWFMINYFYWYKFLNSSVLLPIGTHCRNERKLIQEFALSVAEIHHELYKRKLLQMFNVRKNDEQHCYLFTKKVTMVWIFVFFNGIISIEYLLKSQNMLKYKAVESMSEECNITPFFAPHYLAGVSLECIVKVEVCLRRASVFVIRLFS